MLSKFTKIVFFISSYIPLFVLLLIKDFDTDKKWYYDCVEYALFLIMFIILSLVFLLILLRKLSKIKSMKTYTIEDYNNNNSEVLAYIITYFFPFLNISTNNQEILLAAILVLIGIIYCKTDMYALNPILLLLGYNDLHITVKSDANTETKQIICISKMPLSSICRDNRIRLFHITGNLYYGLELK